MNQDSDFPTPPALLFFARVCCDVAPAVTLGPAPLGERRHVPILGGTVTGPGLSGRILPGGGDWQTVRADGMFEIDAHYAIRIEDGATVEVRSQGLRCGSPEVLAALGRGEAAPPTAYYFRTFVRLTTGAPDWMPLNNVLLLSRGERRAAQVLLDLYRVG